MATNIRPVYKRILLKLSGKALQGIEGFGIGAGILDRMTQETKELVELGIQVGVVTGGGNLFRGADLTKAGINHVVDNHIGILATVMNGLTVHDALHRTYMNARLISAVPLNGVCDSCSWTEAINLLYNNCMVIPFAGTGSPFLTTDSVACLRGIEAEADMVLKATKVNDVFTADPAKDPTAAMYEQLTYSEVLEKELKVMDLATFTLARDHRLPIRVFNMSKPGVLRRAIMGREGGTLIAE